MTFQIKFSQVDKSYNGKSGCMCGCNGNYSLPSHTPDEKLDHDYQYLSEDISDRRVKLALKKVNDAIKQFGHLPESEQQRNGLHLDMKHAYASIESDTRNTTVYFNP